MKKVVSIVAIALITCSMGACTNRNTALRNPVTQGNNATANSIAYRDGIYLGEGNRNSDGNHAAIVRVENGRIVNVVLKTIDSQGKETSVSDQTWGVTGTTGTSSTTPAGRAGTAGTGLAMTDGNRTGTIGGTTGGAVDGYINNRNIGTADTAANRIRRELAIGILQNQNQNVTVSNARGSDSSVNNWKLAVSRALESAKTTGTTTVTPGTTTRTPGTTTVTPGTTTRTPGTTTVTPGIPR